MLLLTLILDTSAPAPTRWHNRWTLQNGDALSHLLLASVCLNIWMIVIFLPRDSRRTDPLGRADLLWGADLLWAGGTGGAGGARGTRATNHFIYRPRFLPCFSFSSNSFCFASASRSLSLITFISLLFGSLSFCSFLSCHSR